jgi:hypothetical protein
MNGNTRSVYGCFVTTITGAEIQTVLVTMFFGHFCFVVGE